jgi:CheY-like chemotaxis protein
MPGMNGIELSRAIKKKGWEKSVIIMISAAEWNVIEEDARDAGVYKFLSKPLFPSSVVDSINQCIGLAGVLRAENSERTIQDRFPDKRLLLVEDVELNREILITLLEPSGIQINCAENGIEALKTFSASPDAYDMIFMDVQMPEMDGYEATRRIRILENSRARGPKRVPIVAMTANVFREDIEKCLEAGMDDHLGKPLDLEEVLGKLRIFLSGE